MVDQTERRRLLGINPIMVWPFHSAPEAYRNLSPHFGDEDWVAFVPSDCNDPVDWLASGTPFGRCETSAHEVTGGTVYIGAHA